MTQLLHEDAGPTFGLGPETGADGWASCLDNDVNKMVTKNNVAF
jgi:hypothetical protein